MDFKTWYRSMTREERAAYAERAETTIGYIEIQLIPRNRIPRPALMQRLADASLGRLAYEDVVRYFLQTRAA
jgi:hypothetical protein